MSVEAEDRIPWRVQGAIYATGLFSNSSFHLYNLVVPLWLVVLQPSPFMIGIVIGCRQFLPIFLSIHGGALMDRLGTRRVMIVFAALTVITPLLYPLAPWIWALVAIQMVGGLAVMLCWIGAQTLVGQVMKGNPTYSGRLSFCTRIGVFIGPPAAGAAWDFIGPWGAFSMLALWGGGTLVATLLVPAPPEPPSSRPPARRRPTVAELMPNMSDYAAAFSLLAAPTIALIMVATLARHSGIAVMGSFYVVYLQELNISGAAIGMLISATGICGAAGALMTGPLARRFGSTWLLLGVVAVTVVAISITPLLGLYVILMAAIGLRGVTNGISQALEISLMAQATDASSQGKGVALRITGGRLVAFVTPVIMGAVVEFTGLEYGFYIMGGAILAALLASALWLRRMAP